MASARHPVRITDASPVRWKMRCGVRGPAALLPRHAASLWKNRPLAAALLVILETSRRWRQADSRDSCYAGVAWSTREVGSDHHGAGRPEHLHRFTRTARA